MRVLLIATNRHGKLMNRMEARPLPIGLAYVAGHLDQTRHSLKVLDLMFFRRRLSGRGGVHHQKVPAQHGGNLHSQPGEPQLHGPPVGVAGYKRGHRAGQGHYPGHHRLRRPRIQLSAQGVLRVCGAGLGNRWGRWRDLRRIGRPVGRWQ